MSLELNVLISGCPMVFFDKWVIYVETINWLLRHSKRKKIPSTLIRNDGVRWSILVKDKNIIWIPSYQIILQISVSLVKWHLQSAKSFILETGVYCWSGQKLMKDTKIFSNFLSQINKLSVLLTQLDFLKKLCRHNLPFWNSHWIGR